MPSTRYSFGTPTFLPFRSADNAASQLGTSSFSEVASLASKPAIASSMIAQSRTSRAIGPAWSSEEAKAIVPQR